MPLIHQTNEEREKSKFVWKNKASGLRLVRPGLKLVRQLVNYPFNEDGWRDREEGGIRTTHAVIA